MRISDWSSDVCSSDLKVIDFSDPYYESGLAILVNKDNNAIKTAKDLEGKMVAVKIGTATVDYLKANVPNATLKLFSNIDNAFLELATGRVDAVVHDTPNCQYFAQIGRSEDHTSELSSLMRI